MLSSVGHQWSLALEWRDVWTLLVRGETAAVGRMLLASGWSAGAAVGRMLLASGWSATVGRMVFATGWSAAPGRMLLARGWSLVLGRTLLASGWSAAPGRTLLASGWSATAAPGRTLLACGWSATVGRILLARGWSPHSLSSGLSVVAGDLAASSSRDDNDLSLPLIIGVKICFGIGLTLLLSSHDTCPNIQRADKAMFVVFDCVLTEA